MGLAVKTRKKKKHAASERVRRIAMTMSTTTTLFAGTLSLSASTLTAGGPIATVHVSLVQSIFHVSLVHVSLFHVSLLHVSLLHVSLVHVSLVYSLNSRRL